MAPKTRGGRKRKTEEGLEGENAGELEAEKRGGSKQKQRGNKKYIGAHVSIQGKVFGRLSKMALAYFVHKPFVSSAGGIWKALESCTEMGGNCFALFLGSQRSWKRPALDLKAATKFQEQRSLHEIDPAHVLPHGSYLMNCGSPKPGLWPVDVSELCTNSVLCQFSIISLLKFSLLIFTDSTLSTPPPDVFEKSQAMLVDELSRCSLLGLTLYNFHPGSSLGLITTEQCVEKIAGAINHAHQQMPAVVTGTGRGLNAPVVPQ